MKKYNHDEDFQCLLNAEQYLAGYNNWLGQMIKAENSSFSFRDYIDENQEINFYSFIFESNNIESEGLTKEGTEKLVNESWKIWTEFVQNTPSEFLKFFSHVTDFSRAQFEDDFHEKIWTLIESKILDKKSEEIAEEFNLPPCFMFNGKVKDAQVAFNQFIALIYANAISYSNLAHMINRNHHKFELINRVLRVAKV